MPRGNMPRQPSRSGRHEGIRPAKSTSSKTFRTPSRPAPPRPPKPAKSTAKKSGYDPLNPERVRQIIAGLDQMYPHMTCALTHRSAWELLVATILSAQCTDVRVNMVTPVLFQKYPTVQDFAALEPEQLQPDIYS